MEELRIKSGDAVLAASYTPAGDAALVALHGASDGTRDAAIYKHLHHVLPAAGIGVVTFDRRGEGQSTGDVISGRFDGQVRDALAVRDALDVPTVGLWGFSQGGWVAPLAATRSERIVFLVLVASIGVTPAEQMRYATERQLRLAGYGDDIVAQALKLRRDFEAWVHGDRASEDELREALAAVRDQPWFELAFLPPTLLDDEEVRLWIEEMDFDPRPIFAQIRVPALAFFGEADSWTPVEPSVEAWRAARGQEVEVVIVAGAGHDLTYPDGTFAPEYERKLVAWASRRVAGG
jgi:pimeloyl-ACP methyl ester carboxylesterase